MPLRGPGNGVAQFLFGMAIYTIHGSVFPKRPIQDVFVDADGRDFIPSKVYKSLWLERLLNRQVIVYRDGAIIFFWPARKMRGPGNGVAHFCLVCLK